METAEGLSIIIPACNEEDSIGAILEALFEHLGKSGLAGEVIVVDDGSTDRTAALAEGFPGLVLLRHEENRGYGAAIKTGLRRARFDWSAIIDADGTYPPESLFRLYEARDGSDMVVGARTGREVTYSPLRRLPKIFLSRYMSWIARREIPDMNSGLRVFRTDLARKYSPILPSGFSLTTTITMALMGNDYVVTYRPINYYQRKGKSHIQPVRDTLRFFRLIAMTGMYFAPMRVLGPVILVHAVGFILSFSYDLVVLKNLTDKTIILLTASFNLMAFAALAEMIRKFHEIR